MPHRLFSPRFLVVCGFSFIVFLSAFQLLPVAPFRILALGGSDAASGLFLGFLTYASAWSAPMTGALADRFGFRRVLVTASVAIACFSLAYAVIQDYRVMLAIVVVHGVFWSGLMSSSGAYLTNMLPEARRAEGIGYYGLASVAAIGVAPPIGFWVYHFGWRTLCIEACALNVLMAAVAWTLPDQRPPRAETPTPRQLIEWRVLVLATALFLCSYGYGGLTSFTALYADANHVAPKSLYLTTLAVMILVTRPLLGRVGDRIGYRRVLVPSMVLIACGLACLVVGGTRGWLLVSAVIFGAGWSTAYPAFIGYVMRGVGPERRGAAFGAVLAAFDTGIGTGSISMGWLIGRYGFRAAFAAAAILASCSLPYFLLVDRRFGDR